MTCKQIPEKTCDYHFELPEERIAQEPLANRADARMMIMDRATGACMHSRVGELPLFLRRGDVLVFNDTRVIPARMMGKKRTGGKVEMFFLAPTGKGEWRVLMKASRRPVVGECVVFRSGESAVVLGEEEDGIAIVFVEAARGVEAMLEELGEIPLPPYIRRGEGSTALDKERYQTVYARSSGAVAAPTAGLHFTEHLLAQLGAAGVHTCFVTLHVGLGTFRPVKAELVRDHVMHEEHYIVPPETVEKINHARAHGSRVIAVGTTSVRTLESAVTEHGLVAGAGSSKLFIHPPYPFKVVDGMITNFHLPCSSLIMMVSAMGGYERTMAAYRLAVQEKYRFFSYGDCMLLV